MMHAQEWPLTKLESVTTKIGSGATPRGGKESYKDEGISLIRSLNVYDLEFSRNDLAFIDQQQADSLSNVVVEQNDVLLNITGASVARCCMVPPDILPARVNQHVSIVRANPEHLDTRFLLYSLVSPSYKEYLLTLAQGGATREALTKSTIENFEITLPPLPIQRRIAEVLSAYDDLIENNRQRITALEATAQDFYREWFNEMRFPGWKQVDWVDSDYGSLPTNWGWVRLSDAVEINPRHRLPKDTEKFYLPMAGVSENSMLISDYEFRTGNSGAKFKNGDTLFARITPSLENGKTGFVQFLPNDEEVAIGSTEFIVMRSRTLCPEFVYLLARTPQVREPAIKSMIGASGRQRVQVEVFDDIYIPQPDEDTLHRFQELVSPLFELIQVLADRNVVLRETRDLLLPRLISGEVSVEGLPLPEDVD